MTKYLISVVGPTAIGKTTLAIQLAKHFNTEIISADSRQFYKEMTIGTAVPSTQELAAAKHHFIQHISVKKDYNVGAFEKEAIQLLDTLFKAHNCVVMVGGSGLYVNAVTNGLDYFPDIDPSIRETLNKRLKTEGLEPLQEQLKELDSKSFETIAIDNPKRVIRALEVCLGSGQPYSSFLKQTQTKRPFKVITVGLSADREIIYNRINQRVDMMLEKGLLKEAKTLHNLKHLNALNTVGYKELFKHFDGEWDLDFAVSEIKKNTRRFAKRQLTWFRKQDDILWFDITDSFEDILKTISI